MKQYWFSLFDQATTSKDKKVTEPLQYKKINEWFGPEVAKLFIEWFTIRRQQLSY